MRVGVGVRVGRAKSGCESGETQSAVRGGGDGLRRPFRSHCGRSASLVARRAVRAVGPSRKTGACLQSCTLTGERLSASSARERLHAGNERIMKRPLSKGEGADAGEILPEYDFSRSLRNKYASRYTTGSAVVVLAPDVAAAFPSSEEANEALRALAGIIQKHRSRRPLARRTR